MTRQFKFGDRIRNALVPNLTFIYIRQDSPTTCICLDETAQEKRMIATDMELVPHPDTVRLDWLEKNRASLYHNIAEDIKHGCAPVEVGCLHEENPHGGSTARQAIDAAMRQEAV